MPFPKDFLWGASTSSAQVEGGFDCDGRGLSIWDTKTPNPGCCSFHYGADLYHHYKEDIALMAEMGLHYERIEHDDRLLLYCEHVGCVSMLRAIQYEYHGSVSLF